VDRRLGANWRVIARCERPLSFRSSSLQASRRFLGDLSEKPVTQPSGLTAGAFDSIASTIRWGNPKALVRRGGVRTEHAGRSRWRSFTPFLEWKPITLRWTYNDKTGVD
jgi:hypothetical protein